MKHAENSNAIYAKALEGIKFPATRDELVAQAKANNASEHVVSVLQHMPNDDTYNIMPDVFMNTKEGKDKVAAQQMKSSTEASKPAQPKATQAKAAGKK